MLLKDLRFIMKKDIVILGGGVATLGVAYYLTNKGYNPIIIEKENSLGGLASSYKINNFRIDNYYHLIFSTDDILLKIINDLGLNDRLVWKKVRMDMYYKDRFYPFTSPFDLLLFRPLKFLDRIRFGINILKLRRTESFEYLDSFTAKEWIINNWGIDIYNKIFFPLLKIKFGTSMDKTSAAFVFGRVKARASSRSKMLTSEKFGYVTGGFQVIIDKLEERLKRKGCKIVTKAKITELKKDKKGFEITFILNNRRKKIKTDSVINTLPLPVLSQLLKNFDKTFTNKIKQVEYQGIICASMGLKNKLSNSYWININSDRIPFGGVIEHTNFVPSEYYEGQPIAYMFNYVGQEHRYWKMSDKEIIEEYFKGLLIMFKDFKRENVLWYKVSRNKHATPIFTKGYGEKVKGINDSYKGLKFAGSYLIYPKSRNVNNIIKSGFEAAKSILQLKEDQ